MSQEIIDQLVAAVATNDQGRIDQLGRDLRDQDEGVTGDWLDGGPLVTNDTIQEGLRRFAELSDNLSEERATALWEGAPVDLHEFREFSSSGAAGVFENIETTFWHISEVQASSGGNAYVVGCVYSSGLDGVDQGFLGIAKTEAEARSIVRRLCYTGLDDLANRYPTALQRIGDLFAIPVKEDLSPLAQDRKRFAQKRLIDGFVNWKRNQYRSQELPKPADSPEEHRLAPAGKASEVLRFVKAGPKEHM